MSKILVRFISFLSISLICYSILLAAEGTRTSEWNKLREAAKKEGKIVIAIPPAAELRKEMEIAVKQKLGLEAEFVPNPGPRNASRIAAEQKAGVRYFDALIVGTGTAVGLAHGGMLEPIEPFLTLPEVKDPKKWWGGHIWEQSKHQPISLFFPRRREHAWHLVQHDAREARGVSLVRRLFKS